MVPASSPALLLRDDGTRRQILSSTVQIVMYAGDNEGSKNEVGSLGLGTLVKSGGQTFLVTHDHWSYLTARLREVDILNADGRLLLAMDAAAFEALIRYRDGGTMILHAPQELIGVVPAPVAQTDRVVSGTILWFVRYSVASGGTAVEVVPGSVEAIERLSHPPRLHVRMLDGSAAIPGDSGGGVWNDGHLMGNVWANGVKERRAIDNVWTAKANNLARVLIVVALLPLQHNESSADELDEHPLASLINNLDW